MMITFWSLQYVCVLNKDLNQGLLEYLTQITPDDHV